MNHNEKHFNITQWCQKRIRQMTDRPMRCIDATAGAGKDALFLCSLMGEGGKLLAMDIQKTALEKTANRLIANGYEQQIGDSSLWGCYRKDRTEVRLVLDGHECMDKYAWKETADIIMFNLGYLPGGDHSLATKAETTLEALEKSLYILKKGGLLSLMIYSGGDSGFEERDQVLSWLKSLDVHRYLVLLESFYNRPNHPPLPVFIRKI
ncbi:MAG: SAM-dependent methyltransferase [Clostridiales bacterium]|nr:SAM-dependent methyltransferase [Clostridiales bacterium]